MGQFVYRAGKAGTPNSSATPHSPAVMTADTKTGPETREEVLVLDPRTQNKKPPFYKVVMLNDDYTPMDFVVEVLKTVFRKDHQEAISTMLQIHHKGSAICGIFTRDVAETKIEIVVSYARQNEFPLQCVMEKE